MADLEAVINPEPTNSNTGDEPDPLTDLHTVIGFDSTITPGEQNQTMRRDEEVASPDPRSLFESIEEEDSSPLEWPPQVHEHIAGNFSDGFHIGEVMEVKADDYVSVSYMELKEVLTAHPDEHKRRFWKWPSKRIFHDTHRHCIINLRPCLVLQSPPSSKRNFIFSCLNAELLEAMASSVTEELIE